MELLHFPNFVLLNKKCQYVRYHHSNFNFIFFPKKFFPSLYCKQCRSKVIREKTTGEVKNENVYENMIYKEDMTEYRKLKSFFIRLKSVDIKGEEKDNFFNR